MRWMKLEPIIQSEVSHKEKHKYYILTHMEFRKTATMILYARQQKKNKTKQNTEVKNRLLAYVGEGQGGMI